MKRYTLFIICSLTAAILLLSSCKKSDDIDRIFEGRTWYMMNGVIQGTKVPNNTNKEFYTSSTATYFVFFGSGTVNGVLSSGISFSGTWTADGKDQTLQLNINGDMTNATAFDREIYNLLRNTKRYTGDENTITIYSDDVNFISFSPQRSSKN